ncbi:MAG: hypothetical protein M1457_09005, partial [bacterium]|nr:hypothetical protein [bacterium]
GLHWAWAWTAFALPAVAAGGVLLTLNALHFGGPFEVGYADQREGVAFSAPALAGLYGFFFSVGKGLFFFSPALALGLVGWGPLWRTPDPRAKAVTAAMALLVVVPLVVHAKWQNWAGGWCWGPRHIFIIHPFLAIPIAAWLAGGAGAAARIAVPVVFALGVGVQLLGCSQNFIEFYQRFYRSPGDPSADFVLYDPYDQEYWGRYYQLLYRPASAGPFRPVPLAPPAPIQHSLYLPGDSVWAGYPVMLREGRLDNFWVRAFGGRAAPPAGDGAP